MECFMKTMAMKIKNTHLQPAFILFFLLFLLFFERGGEASAFSFAKIHNRISNSNQVFPSVFFPEMNLFNVKKYSAKGEGEAIDTHAINGDGTQQDAKINPPEKEDDYPEPDMFGKLPSYGFYIRHASGITLDNIQLSYAKKEDRPPFVLDDVHGSSFRFIKAEHTKSSAFSEKYIKKEVKRNL